MNEPRVPPPLAALGPLRLSAGDAARVDEISRLAKDGAVEELVGLLAEPSWAVRRAVVSSLARTSSAVDLLCAVLVGERTSEAVLAAAVDALSASRGDADDAVLRLITEGQSAAVLCDAAQILGRRKSTRAVAALAQLLASGDENVAAAAAEALGRIGGTGTVEPLILAVESREFFRTFPAISPLGHSGDPRAVPPLVALLSEPLYSADAAEALGYTAHLTAVPPLVALLVNVDDALVRGAAGALTRLRPDQETRFDEALRKGTADATFATAARSRLRACIRGGRPSEKIALSVVLGWLQDDSAIAELVELFREKGEDVGAIGAALGALGPLAEPRLLQAVREGDSAQRLRFMILIKPRRAALSVFVACLDDAEARVRALACQALARIGDVTVVPALFRLLGDANAHASQSAVAAIQSLGCLETKALALEGALSSDRYRRRASLRIIAYFGFPEGLDVMVEAMSDPDDRIRDAAIYGLPFIEDPRALTLLLAASESAAPRTRASAMRALGQTTDQGAVPGALRRGVRDDDAWVRYYACQALGRLAVGAALGDVIALMDDPAGQVRVAAIEAMAKLGDGQATAVLDGACGSPDPDIRRAAILGLGGSKRAEALAILLREVCSKDSATRLYALSALAEIDSDRATEALARATLDPDLMVKSAAIGFLSARSGPKATRWLIAQLLDEQGKTGALAALQNPVAGRIDEILVALQTGESPLTPLLIGALARMHSPAGQAAIEMAFAFDNVHSRRSAALALTALDSPESRALLEGAKLADPDDEVRRICTAALR